jgi:hypothetical protein
MDSIQLGQYRLAAENRYLKLKRTEFQAWVAVTSIKFLYQPL